MPGKSPLKCSGLEFREYKNHAGIVDAYTQTGVSGNGSATPNIPNHRMDLASTGFNGKAKFETIASWAPGSNQIVCNFIIQNWSKGVGGVPTAVVGMKQDFLSDTFANTIGFFYSASGVWNTRTSNSVAATTNSIPNLVSGDELTIIITSSEVKFRVNNVNVSTHTTNIPTTPIYLGAFVVSTSSTSVPITIGIDYLAIMYPL